MVLKFRTDIWCKLVIIRHDIVLVTKREIQNISDAADLHHLEIMGFSLAAHLEVNKQGPSLLLMYCSYF
jgi:hypothetical protein